ncbi:MAG TPA: GNAT family N-acetyltransferase [Ilumatobacteraceae bacterium]|nr:GNAT family N-acetyltransferase [Ilumatobacteraceae bacterium]
MIESAGDMIISTSRLVLQPLQVADAEEMCVVLGDVALHQFTGGEPATVEELRARYAIWVEGSGSPDELWFNWIVRRVADGIAVGTVQATVMQPQGDAVGIVAWSVGVPWQRQGYAVEAAVGLVEWLVDHGIESVVAHVHPDHHASAAVASRAGLRRTSEVSDGEVVWRTQSV